MGKNGVADYVDATAFDAVKFRAPWVAGDHGTSKGYNRRNATASPMPGQRLFYPFDAFPGPKETSACGER